jgi:flagellin-like hook-associated protein FlgL
VYSLGQGVEFNIAEASAPTRIVDVNGNSSATGFTLDPSSLGYDGRIDLTLDADALELTKDAQVRVSLIPDGTTGKVIVGDGTNTSSVGQVKVELVGTGIEKTFSAVSGTAETLAGGFSITFTNDYDAESITLKSDGANSRVDTSAAIALTGNYNDAYGDKTLAVKFKNVSSASVSAAEGTNTVFDVGSTAATLTPGSSYTGHYGTQSLNVIFEGTEVTLGGPAGIALDGVRNSYSGRDGDVKLEVEHVAATFENVGNLTHDFSVTTTDVYNGLDGDQQITVAFNGTLTSVVDHSGISAATINVVSYDDSNHSWALGDVENIAAEFVTANTIQFTVAGNTADFNYSAGGTQSYDLTSLQAGIVTVGYVDPATITSGSGFDIEVTENHSVEISDGSTIQSVAISSGSTNINLAAEGFITNDPNFDLTVSGSSTGDAQTYTFNLKGPKANVYKLDAASNRVAGALVSNIDISGGEINLDTAAAALFTNNTDITLDIASPTTEPGASWFVDLETKSTVTIKTGALTLLNREVVINGDGTGTLNLDTELSDDEKKQLFGGDSIEPGGDTSLNLELTFTDVDKLIDDEFTVSMVKTPTLEIEKVDGSGFETVTVDPSSEELDLTGIIGPSDPGFKLKITDAINGFDDEYAIDLKTGDVTSGGDIADLNVRSMQVGDTFTAQLTGDVLEVGDQYAVQVQAPHLNAGTQYTIEEDVDRLELGDTMTIDVDSAFEPTVYTAQASTPITNGLTLDFNGTGTFEVGDEFRFQASGYRGGFSVFGQYTDPAYPTTIEVEVITEGDVDGGAVLRARRQDGGAINDAFDDADPNALFVDFNAVTTAQTLTVGGDGYIGKGVFMQFDQNLGADESHRLYKGDKFYLDVIGSLSQNFAAGISLESDNNIMLEYSETNVDNKLGRLLYVGDEDAANNPGTIGSLSKAVLAVNTEFSIAKIDLMSQEGAEDAMLMVDHAIGRIDESRSKMGAMQNRMSSEINTLSEAAFQTERYGSRIKDADIAAEVAELTSAQIRQQAGIGILQQINQSGSLSLILVESLLG